MSFHFDTLIVGKQPFNGRLDLILGVTHFLRDDNLYLNILGFLLVIVEILKE